MAKKILLADDSITIQKVVELTFAEGDYEVVCASDGAQAVRKIEETPPDIALVDVMMPQRNGYEVCAHVKQDPNLAWIPVLLLTGTFEPFDPRRADQVGANGHIVKPFESRSLVSLVEELISKNPRPQAEEAEPEPIAPSDASEGAEVVNAGQIFAATDQQAEADEATKGRGGPEPGAAEPSGPATVRLDSRSFFSQFAAAGGSEVVETPQPPAAPPGAPSLGPLDLSSAEGEVEPTHPVRAVQRAPEAQPASEQPPSEDVERIVREKIESVVKPMIRETVERVLTEVAWEVIPEVAESLVRRRMKELEEEAASEEDASLH